MWLFMPLPLSNVGTFSPVINEYHDGGTREDFKTQYSTLHVRLSRYKRIGLCVWMIDMVKKAR